MFVVEGEKMLLELLSSNFEIVEIFAKKDYDLSSFDFRQNIQGISSRELQRISSLKAPNKVLAIVKIPDYFIEINKLNKGFSVMLDGISNPGNLGNIIRTCDWFGIQNIICSKESVDAFNPKVIQSTMGSIFRVQIYYENLIDVLSQIDSSIPIYGSFLQGKSVSTFKFPENGIIIFGNESDGVSEKITPFLEERLTISNISKNSESLNIGSAVAIFLHTIFLNKF